MEFDMGMKSRMGARKALCFAIAVAALLCVAVSAGAAEPNESELDMGKACNYKSDMCLTHNIVAGEVIVVMKEYTEIFPGLNIVRILSRKDLSDEAAREEGQDAAPPKTVFEIKLRKNTMQSVSEAIEILERRDDVEYARQNERASISDSGSELPGSSSSGELIVGMKQYTELFPGLDIVSLQDSIEVLRAISSEEQIGRINPGTRYQIKLREQTCQSSLDAIAILQKRQDVDYAVVNHIVSAPEFVPDTNGEQTPTPGGPGNPSPGGPADTGEAPLAQSPSPSPSQTPPDESAAPSPTPAPPDGEARGSDADAEALSGDGLGTRLAIAFLEPRPPYMFGYPDGSIRPDEAVTRAEAVSMLYRLIDDDLKDSVAAASFTDVPADAWHERPVAYASSKGIAFGYPDGGFRPDGLVTRAEFAAIISRVVPSPSPDAAAQAFVDVGDGHWAYVSVGECAASGLINGYPDGTFQPEGTISRAEAAAVLNRLLGLAAAPTVASDAAAPATAPAAAPAAASAVAEPTAAASTVAEAPAYPDLPADHWAYADIVSASMGK